VIVHVSAAGAVTDSDYMTLLSSPLICDLRHILFRAHSVPFLVERKFRDCRLQCQRLRSLQMGVALHVQ
jgi:hypothetical protein